MTTFGLIIACIMATFSTPAQPTTNPIPSNSKTSLSQPVEMDKWETKQQMLETGMTQMDRYERFLSEPKMTFNPMGNA